MLNKISIAYDSSPEPIIVLTTRQRKEDVRIGEDNSIKQTRLFSPEEPIIFVEPLRKGNKGACSIFVDVIRVDDARVGFFEGIVRGCLEFGIDEELYKRDLGGTV